MLTVNRMRPRTRPWGLFNPLHHDLNRELAEWLNRAGGAVRTPMGVWTRGDAAIVAIELPGRVLDDIEVSLLGQVVTLEAKAPALNLAGDLPEDVQLVRRERSATDIRRQIELPFAIDATRTEATYERGLLVLRLRAPETAQPARIDVQAG